MVQNILNQPQQQAPQNFIEHALEQARRVMGRMADSMVRERYTLTDVESIKGDIRVLKTARDYLIAQNIEKAKEWEDLKNLENSIVSHKSALDNIFKQLPGVKGHDRVAVLEEKDRIERTIVDLTQEYNGKAAVLQDSQKRFLKDHQLIVEALLEKKLNLQEARTLESAFGVEFINWIIAKVMA